MPTVFLIAQPTVKRNGVQPDLTPLAKFGDVKVVLPSGDNPSRRPSQAVRVIDDRLRNFDPATDFLAWAGGDTLSAIMVGYLMAEYHINAFTWLRFDREREQGTGRRLDTGYYTPVVVDMQDSQLALHLTDPHEDETDDDN